jgi:hypothetical protein
MEFLADYASQSLHLMKKKKKKSMEECFNKIKDRSTFASYSFLLIHLIDLKSPPLNAVSPSHLDQKVEEIQKQKKRQKRKPRKQDSIIKPYIYFRLNQNRLLDCLHHLLDLHLHLRHLYLHHLHHLHHEPYPLSSSPSPERRHF